MRRRDFIKRIAGQTLVWPFAVRLLIAGFLGAIFAVCGCGDFAAAQTSFVAPPRTTADITAILDQEKPDPAKAAKVRGDADATPPPSLNDDRGLAQFYFARAQARAGVGRNVEAIADCEQAIVHGGKVGGDIDGYNVDRYQEFMSNQHSLLGDSRRAIEINQTLAR
jgi:hypothetical protein